MTTLDDNLKDRSCYVCSRSQVCALRRAGEKLLVDFPDFIDVDEPSPPSWQWIPVAIAKACVYFDYREEK